VFLAALILCGTLALAARVPEFTRTFDQQFDGFQGAFFALAAIGYERDDLSAIWPYPIVQVEAPVDLAKDAHLYANHPPLVPQLAHGALRVLGPSGWQDAWREGRPPAGIEGVLRAPFVLAQILAAVLFALALRELGVAQAGAAAAVVFALLPGALVYAGLVNYENPSLLATALIALLWARFLRRGRAGWALLALLGGAGTMAGWTTYMPLFFVPPLAVLGFAVVRARVFAPLLAVILGSAAGLGAHAILAGRALRALGRSSEPLAGRARDLIAPLFDGSLPLSEWLAVQSRVVLDHIGLVPLLLAAGGIVLGWRAAQAPLAPSAASAASALSATSAKALRLNPRVPVAFALALLIGGALVQVAFYRHTGDPQEPFALHLAPGIAALAGVALHRLAAAGRPLAAALLLVGTAALGLLGAARLAEPWRVFGPTRPSPLELGGEVARHVPRGAVVWYPSALGLTPAVSFYAWRTLLPVEPPLYAQPALQTEAIGLGSAAVYFAEPRGVFAGPDAAAASERAISDLRARRPGAEPTGEGRWLRFWKLK